ncbi:hypothetical protein N825_02655 [Skermanella stibiiresistens SB22]|uniref:Uncharacterized protein n=1 Tax=Skermanella stibiiresistens SB22 TaxID=1385369 RepID=W9HDT5_9PROT|nr:hypothetical protein N825_02655 [Skermanella stibiiresistens SB22]
MPPFISEDFYIMDFECTKTRQTAEEMTQINFFVRKRAGDRRSA